MKRAVVGLLVVVGMLGVQLALAPMSVEGKKPKSAIARNALLFTTTITVPPVGRGTTKSNYLPGGSGPCDLPWVAQFTLTIAGDETWDYWFDPTNGKSAYVVLKGWLDEVDVLSGTMPNPYPQLGDYTALRTPLAAIVTDVNSGNLSFRQLIYSYNEPDTAGTMTNQNRKTWLKAICAAGLDIGFLDMARPDRDELFALLPAILHAYENDHDFQINLLDGIGDVSLLQLYTTEAYPDWIKNGTVHQDNGVPSALCKMISTMNDYGLIQKNGPSYCPKGDATTFVPQPVEIKGPPKVSGPVQTFGPQGGPVEQQRSGIATAGPHSVGPVHALSGGGPNYCCCNDINSDSYRKCSPIGTTAGCSMCTNYCCLNGLHYCAGSCS